MGQWRLRAGTIEASAPQAHALQQEKPADREAHSLQPESRPCSPQLEKDSVPQQRPGVAKVNRF